jgi:glycosyltransferase involved in cell wall biosynthesis
MKQNNLRIKKELLKPSKRFVEKQLNPEITILIPSLNEELTISKFIDWCWEGIKKSKLKGEIIIIDSSWDKTPQLALKKGAYVLRTPKRGLGQAYIDAIPFVNGRFVILGDCDLTYDFRKIDLFVKKYRANYDFIMGSRYKGFIEKKAMPFLHQYFGTPVTTFILNFIYKSNFTDIHCGMRGLSKDALHKINLTSPGWEYASEMIIKAIRNNLKSCEVPVYFYKDIKGRESHHKRSGFLSPWIAGWENLRVMFVYAADYFFIKPSILLILAGTIIATLSFTKKIIFMDIRLNTHSFIIGLITISLGLALFQLGKVSKNIHKLNTRSFTNSKYLDLNYHKKMLISLLLITIGTIGSVIFFYEFKNNGYVLNKNSHFFIMSIFGIFYGLLIMCFSILNELIRIELLNKRG